jgi:trk system potassium uptake protein TrkH
MNIIKKVQTRLQQSNPVRLVSVGYIIYILVGVIALSVPFSQKVKITFLDNLFISTSAVSTTGLVTVSVSDSYTLFGQIVILLLIQFGGLGYMTFGSFVMLSTKRVLSDSQKGISSTVFSIPSNFIIEKFIRSVVSFTFITEVIGMACLLPIFIKEGVANPLWNAIFHSISAFCTAGFSLFNSSFEAYSSNFWLNITIAILSTSGAIGFIAYVDIWRSIRGKQDRMTFTTGIIIRTTLLLIILGTMIIALTEDFDKSLPPETRILKAFFQSMTSVTTVGFDTYPINKMSLSSLTIIIIWMIIGASPSGTGGGLKTTTFTAVLAVIRSTLRGDHETTWRGIPIPLERIRIAAATLGFYMLVLVLGIFFLTLTENQSLISIGFETASALGTVGLSLGITSNLTFLGKAIIIILMYIGRVGVLTFGTAVFVRPELIFDNEKNELVL